MCRPAPRSWTFSYRSLLPGSVVFRTPWFTRPRSRRNGPQRVDAESGNVMRDTEPRSRMRDRFSECARWRTCRLCGICRGRFMGAIRRAHEKRCVIKRVYEESSSKRTLLHSCIPTIQCHFVFNVGNANRLTFTWGWSVVGGVLVY